MRPTTPPRQQQKLHKWKKLLKKKAVKATKRERKFRASSIKAKKMAVRALE